MAFTSSSSHDDDDDGMYSSLKAEKADAIRKFNQQQNLFYFGRLLAASLLLLWSFRTLPFLTQIASEYVSLFGQQLCAFLLANAIVIFVYHFSTAAANNTIAAASASVVNLSSSSSLPPSSLRPDIYDEYVSLRQRPTLNGGRVLEEIIPQPAGADILFPSNISCDEQVKEVDTAANNLMGEEGLEDGKKEKRLRRTRSVVGEATREKNTFSDGSNYNKGNDDTNRSGERKELRRSETVVMKKRTGAAALALGKSLSFNQARKSIEEMNNDEFNMTVESFIATKKKLLRDENIAATDFNHRHSFAVACPMR